MIKPLGRAVASSDLSGEARMSHRHAHVHLAAELFGGRPNELNGAPQRQERLLICHDTVKADRPALLHLRLRQSEIARADLGQLVHRSRTTTEGACPRKS